MRVKLSALFVFSLMAAGAAQAQTAGIVTLRANSTSAQTSLVPVLTWSTNPAATSCRASGGWSGTKAASGSETLASINASTNYTLTCSWDSGTARVSWVAPTTNTDNSALTNLAGFRVYYGTSSTSLSQSTTLSDIAARSATISALAPGTWYFMVRVFNSAQAESDNSNVAQKVVAGATAAGTVGITITAAPPPTPPTTPTPGTEVEPNNSMSQAEGVPSTSGTTVNGTIAASNDMDYYRVSVPAGKRLTVKMQPNSTSDYEMYIYDSRGRPIGSSFNGVGVAEVLSATNSSSSAATYYVRIYYYSGPTGSSGKYTVLFSW